MTQSDQSTGERGLWPLKRLPNALFIILLSGTIMFFGSFWMQYMYRFSNEPVGSPIQRFFFVLLHHLTQHHQTVTGSVVRTCNEYDQPFTFSAKNSASFIDAITICARNVPEFTAWIVRSQKWVQAHLSPYSANSRLLFGHTIKCKCIKSDWCFWGSGRWGGAKMYIGNKPFKYND